MKTIISSKGQIVLPARFRKMDDVKSGQEFDVERLGKGEYRLVRRSRIPNAGVVVWLESCPEKGYFVAVESESTDTV